MFQCTLVETLVQVEDVETIDWYKVHHAMRQFFGENMRHNAVKNKD